MKQYFTKQFWIKTSAALTLVALLGSYACLEMQDRQKAVRTVPQTPVVETLAVDENTSFLYTKDNLPETCLLDSTMACGVEFAVKCTLDPDFSGCRDSKLPRFIFMEDENLQRPTTISFQIVKIKPINADLVELHTDSTCDGNWFGLCQGRVIYVLVPDNQGWRVKDIYAISK